MNTVIAIAIIVPTTSTFAADNTVLSETMVTVADSRGSPFWWPGKGAGWQIVTYKARRRNMSAFPCV